MRNVEIAAKVQQVFEVREFQTETRSGKVGSFIVGDETGTIRVVLWGSQADKLSQLKENDIIKVQSAYVKENRGRKEVHLGDQGSLDINPEGESIGEVKKINSTRKSINELAENMQDVEVLGTVVQVYDIKFFDVCPECGKKTLPKEGSAICSQHGSVTSTSSYVFNAIIDDGTGNIRAAFFRKQVENLLKKSQDEIVEFRDSAEKFEQVKHDLLGKQIKIVGRVNKNMMFDRIELIAQLVFPDPDPEEEIKRLQSEKPAESSNQQGSVQESTDTGSVSSQPAPETEQSQTDNVQQSPVSESSEKPMFNIDKPDS
ncbi:hypothetical protein GF345_02520 [Candidatus Woesearchaeota archaeon]|nr:hypothetical protein [Candidatus Woesearchaeota archaeon]